MHMARDSRDAKRQLTEEGAVTKMRDIVEAYDPDSESSEALVVPAVSCLVNLAVDTEYWGQAELASEKVMDPVRRAFARAAPASKFAQVCVAFTHAFVKNNPDNAFIAAESGVLPVLAYHHLHGRDKQSKKEKLAAREALERRALRARVEARGRGVDVGHAGVVERGEGRRRRAALERRPQRPFRSQLRLLLLPLCYDIVTSF